jgi:deoxyribodipyrimidine photo-lyase
MNSFPVNKKEIYALLENIQPELYGKTRNYLNGSVTKLSPYISRGVFSTRSVFEYLKSQKYSWFQVEKLLQELAWRDYFQLVWVQLGSKINQDIKHPQHKVRSFDLPYALLKAQTGIEAVDLGIKQLHETGYMHNHVRMYTASLVCNIAQCYWLNPAHWMYYHLLDADWASNACSWQWVAGSFSNKKYYANQENINRYCFTNQKATYLDVPYEDFENLEIPSELIKIHKVDLSTQLPQTGTNFMIQNKLPTLIYNWYNLDFEWYKGETMNRVLLLEPSVFEQYPISATSVKFMLDLAQNIPNIQVFCGNFKELKAIVDSSNSDIIFKEHPLNKYEGILESRSFLHKPLNKSFNSFFSFWKTIEKGLRLEFEN